MRSMTGFGRAAGEALGRRCVIEIRTVNHRFLDLKLRLAPGLSDPVLEQLLTQALRRRIDRGSVVLSLRDEGAGAGDDAAVRIDQRLAQAHAGALRELAAALGIAPWPGDAWPTQATLGLLPLILAQPGVLLGGESLRDPEALFQQLEPLLDQACAALFASREREGAALLADLLQRLALVEAQVAEISALAAGAPEVQRRKLEERLGRLLAPGGERLGRLLTPEAGGRPLELDPQRLAQEVALLADRLDITEELTRLRTHLHEFARLCQSEALAGRRLDFLTQEINREVNTIAAKSQSADVAARVVAIKAELERLREQIQNVE